MPKLLNPWQSSVLPFLRALCALLICQHITVDLPAQSTMFLQYDRESRANAQGYEWLEWSTAHIGHRLTGSKGGRLAEDMADSLFRSFPMDTTYRHPFSAQVWNRGSVSVSLLENGAQKEISAVALANTPMEATVMAVLTDLGNGLPADIGRMKNGLAGNIALINIGLHDAPEGTRNLHRSEKAALAIALGVAGIVFVNQAMGHVLLTGTASIDGSLIEVPAVCITAEDGEALRDRLKHGEPLEVSITMNNRSEKIRANNIVAELRGTEKPEEVILIGGHLDSWDLATGATDNGLGSYSILDMARALKAVDHKPRRTIRFVLFMGEEQGLLGSRSLVEHYQATDRITNIRCMINLDMTGDPRGFGLAAPEQWQAIISDIDQRILQVDSVDFKGELSSRIWLHSDHQPFLLAGVPVIYPLSDLGKDVYGCYHSSCDDIHLVDPNAMVNNVRFVGLLLQELANAVDLPPHFSAAELRQRLIEEGLEEQLRIGGDWPW